MHDLLESAMSASGIFKPHKFSNINDSWTDYGFDAGIYVNNPTLQAYLDVKRLYPHKKYLIVSLGTGISRGETKADKSLSFERWGLLQGILPILKTAMLFQSDQTDYQMRMIFKEESSSVVAYYRFNVRANEFKNNSRSPFNASKKNIKHIKRLENYMLKHDNKEINHLVSLLGEIKGP